MTWSVQPEPIDGNVAATGSLTSTGAFSTTFAQTATTTQTLPNTSQTLATLAGTEAFTNKTLDSPTVTTILTLTAGQVAFPATQVPSAGVNVLDDYEEGTWTPTIAFGGNSVGATYGTQTGLYTKIGNRVYYEFQLTLTAKGSSTGSVSVPGLPFAIGGGLNPPTQWWWQSMTTALVHMSTRISGSSLLVDGIAAAATSISQLQHTDFANNTTIIGSGHYRV